MSVAERLHSALAGRYTIERKLGQGGMATVYLAHSLPRHMSRKEYFRKVASGDPRAPEARWAGATSGR